MCSRSPGRGERAPGLPVLTSQHLTQPSLAPLREGRLFKFPVYELGHRGMEQGPTSARAAPLQWGGARGEGRGPSRPGGGGAWTCVHPDRGHCEHTLMGVRGELGSWLSAPGASVEGANAGSFRGVLVVRASARISLGGGRHPPAQPGPWSSWGAAVPGRQDLVWQLT